MSTVAHPSLATRSYASRLPADGVFSSVVLRLRRSRSLASMLPALLFSGLMTMVVTAVMHVTADGSLNHWLESWLTAWPIAFPVAYLAGPVVLKLSAAISAPARMQAREPGLAFGDIADASRRVTRRNGRVVLRGLKPAYDVSAA
ncbi:DUF2798 domain-containing protein [Noviherbaspirillum denitrificans]|uniref:DUF2798 domain-containing protein n=1 Tax=Noviherbaspirillum denitrificans TaxID=1968433 RepID=A0A254TNB2_9BURK|nr:DUF2798 domain-containing protein [Noviherbaspirillum denitrificans]OWW22113.1 hypothetical protein AYR66_24070 [Noviherbaspirillum denitrificans]